MWNWREPSHFVSHSDQVQGDDSEGLKAVRMDPRHQDLLKNVDAPQQPPPFLTERAQPRPTKRGQLGQKRRETQTGVVHREEQSHGESETKMHFLRDSGSLGVPA